MGRMPIRQPKISNCGKQENTTRTATERREESLDDRTHVDAQSVASLSTTTIEARHWCAGLLYSVPSGRSSGPGFGQPRLSQPAEHAASSPCFSLPQDCRRVSNRPQRCRIFMISPRTIRLRCAHAASTLLRHQDATLLSSHEPCSHKHSSTLESFPSTQLSSALFLLCILLFA